VAAVLAYHLLIIHGHGNPDAICEGLFSYGWGAGDWALACGRWATRYMNSAAGNVVMPGIWITLYTLLVCEAVILLVKLWGIRSKAAICLITAIMTVNPTVIEQSLLQYMFMAWGISNLLAVCFVYLNCRAGSKLHAFVTAPIVMALAFGLYQSAVSLICLCFCMTLILGLTDGKSLKETALTILRFLLSAMIGAALYFLILKFELVRYGVAESSRVEDFSIRTMLSSLGTSVPDAYASFFAYYLETVFKRKMWYELLAVLPAAYLGVKLIGMLKSRPWEALCAAALLAMIPLFANAAKILFPYNLTVKIMQYQNMLVFPFLFAVIERGGIGRIGIKNLSLRCACLLTAILCWTYIASANATYSAYETTYRHYNTMTQSILCKVYDTEGYKPGDTIAFAGTIGDGLLRQTLSTYKYAYGMYDDLVFWPGIIGMQSSRQNYFVDYFGINAGKIYAPDYNAAVESEEFKQMGIFPENDSIRRINGMIIVKLSDDPPIFE